MKARRGDGKSRLRAGQCALVTGAGSGIGRAIALALAREGLHVRLVGRDAEKLRQVADCAGGTASVVAADITTEEGRAAIAVATRPDLHVLVHCAGAYSRGSVADTPVSTWSTLSATNLHAPLLVTAACLPQLRAAPGQVAFINSTAVMRPGAGIAAYAASKQALRAAVDALREEVNGDGIRVISMFPGRTATPMQKDILAAEGRVARPGALIEPDDIAQMLLAALRLPLSAEVTDIVMRPMRPL